MGDMAQRSGHRSVKPAPKGMVGSNPTSPTKYISGAVAD